MTSPQFRSKPDRLKERKMVISSHSSTSNSLIRVTQSHGNYYVWNACDALRLRREFRIVGYHVGCLPTANLQLNTFGLPLQLLQEELELLLFLRVVSLTRVERTKPEPSLLQEYAQHRNGIASDYLTFSRNEKTHHILKNKDMIIAKYRMKDSTDKTKSDDEIINEKIDTIIKAENPYEKAPVQVFTSCPFKPFIVQAAVPTCHQLNVKYHVFKDLWHRGYFITSGSKFACDFLAYESDPLICHSKFMVVCLDCSRTSAKLKDLLSSQVKGRLSVQVNKRLIFASVEIPSDDCDDVLIEYEEMSWKGKHHLKDFH